MLPKSYLVQINEILQARRPLVTFTADPNGGMVLQERCMEERTCHSWDDGKVITKTDNFIYISK